MRWLDGISDSMEMRQGGRDGVYFRKGDNTRIAGKMQFHERLRFDENGRPKMQIFNTCRQFIRTIPSLPYDLHKVEDVDSDAEDHTFTTRQGTFLWQDLFPSTTRTCLSGRSLIRWQIKERKDGIA